MRMALAAVVAGVGCVAASGGSGAGRDQIVAFTGVTVIPMDRERILSDQTVVVRNGTIVEMGSTRSVAVPGGALRVDGRGRFLMPGLADMHVHPYNAEQLLNYLAYGVTTITVLNGNPEVLRWRREVTEGRRLGPTTYSAGPSLDGFPAGHPLFLATTTPEDGRRAVGDIAAAGYDFVKVYSRLAPEVYAAILAEARTRGIAVFGHIPSRVGVDGVLRSGGHQVVAHAEELFREPVDSARLAAIVATLKTERMTVIPNLSAYADYIRSVDDLPAVLADPEMRFVSPAAYTEKLPASNRSIRPDPVRFRASLVEGLSRFKILTKALAEAEVPILVGTDTELFGFAGQSAHEELRLMAAAGLTPYQALVAGTRAAGELVARTLPGAESFGMVAVGQRADLLLLAANPLESVTRLGGIEGVMVRGRWLPKARLAALRDSLAAATGPRRELARRFDSLATANRLDEAAAILAELRRGHPGSRPIAYAVIWLKAEALRERDPRAAVRLLEWNVEMSPDSHSAHAELARGYLATGDTARAVASAKRALALFGSHHTAKVIANP